MGEKNEKLILAFVAALSGLTFFGCASSSKVSGSEIKGNAAKIKESYVTIFDYQGASFGSEMQRVVGKAVSASQKGRSKQVGDEKEATTLEQELNMYKQAVSAVELNGLEKIASCWIQKEVKESKNSKDSKIYYEYYAVWGMNQKLYNT